MYKYTYVQKYPRYGAEHLGRIDVRGWIVTSRRWSWTWLVCLKCP